MIDLHSHTTASDGTYTPTEQVRLAKEIGLKALAITDHDSTSGVKEAMEEGERLGIRIVPGIEINAKYEGHHVHMVGLMLDPESEAIADMKAKILEIRHNRNRQIYAKLRELGVNITEEDFPADPGHVVTRGEIGRKIVEKGYAQSVNEAFYMYLLETAPAYVPRQSLDPFQAMDIIHRAGGVAIVAHFYQIGDFDLVESERIARIILEAGADGLETEYSKYTPNMRKIAARLADEYGCLRSGGSDFHGTTKPDISLGTGTGNLHVPDEYLTEIDRYLAEKANKK